MNKNPHSFFLILWVVFTGFFAQGQMGPIPFTVKQASFKRDSFYITKFGAKADGVTLNTASINNAITAASQRGGGVVVVVVLSPGTVAGGGAPSGGTVVSGTLLGASVPGMPSPSGGGRSASVLRRGPVNQPSRHPAQTER